MAKYRKKPVVIDAVRYVGDNGETIATEFGIEDWFEEGGEGTEPRTLRFETSEGEQRAEVGSWVILGVNGSIYACTNANFEAAFDPVE
jgi:hypothetical protein